MNQIQKCILDITKEIITICENNNIPYFAIGGTCIGAVRHSGFIPWDDDLDIAIPIEHFFRFKTVAENELPDFYKIRIWEDVITARALIMKIFDIRTTFIEEHELDYKESYKGVFVDVMPIAGIPKNLFLRKVYIKKIRLYQKLNKYHRCKITDIKKPIGKMVWIFLSPLKKMLKFNFFSKLWFENLKKRPFSSSKMTGFVWHGGVQRLIFPTKWVEETVLLDFEDIKMRCPKSYDKYLKAHFGDYMKLPPHEQRVAKHPGIIDCNRSYREYQDNEDLVKIKLKNR